MSRTKWVETLVTAQGDGPTITAAVDSLAIPIEAIATLPPSFFEVGVSLRVKATGIISCVVTTPGTARWRLTVGAAVVLDGGAIPLNVVAKTNVGWIYEAIVTCRQIDRNTANNTKVWAQGRWTSEAVVGSPLPSVGGSGSIILPYNTAPTLSPGFDNRSANQVALFFEQTVATGSLTVQQYVIEACN